MDSLYKGVNFYLINIDNIELARLVVSNIFPEDIKKDDGPLVDYDIVVNNDKNRMEKLKLDYMQFYIAFDRFNHPVGVTGLYRIKDKPIKEIWLGWYGVNPEFTNLGYGSIILEYSELLAKELGAEVLKLWTTIENPSEKRAQDLYLRKGFVFVKKRNVFGRQNVTFREKILL